MDDQLDWLMQGDAAIRWQTMRSLLGAPEAEWQAERQRTLTTGWGAQFLARQDADGRWGSGIYAHKWISTTYTLLNLCSIGVPPDCAPARRGAELVVGTMLGKTCDAVFYKNLAACDRCIVGMMLRIGINFGIDAERIEAMADNLINEVMPDGAWNCRRYRPEKPEHSSFHTTFNVLEGLREYIETGESRRSAGEIGMHEQAARAAEQRALEWSLDHRLFKSHRTGAVIDPNFTYLSFPPYWFYDVLRGLVYFARVKVTKDTIATPLRDERLQDAIDMLQSKRRADGTWPVQHKHSGMVFFDMEKTGGPSRWNTLRALQVLRWWEGAGKDAPSGQGEHTGSPVSGAVL